MHQGHNIPWSAFEKHFTFVVDDKRYTLPFTGLRYKQSPSAPKELQHFARKFAATIEEFSETERKKYSVRIPQSSSNDKVFSDALRDKYSECLDNRYQYLTSWIGRTSNAHGSGVFREVIMILLFENEIETLFMLAQHPQINMAWILMSRCDHYYSTPGEELALRTYMFFNTTEAVGQLFNGGYTRTRQYSFLVVDLSGCACGQRVPHEKLSIWMDTHTQANLPADYLAHTQFEELQEYLKNLFALMYRYDALAREVGVDSRWERKIKDNIIRQGGLPRDMAIDEHNRGVLTALDV
ncbi:hypothetical protein D9619_002156 [Psilocybe cf. subviscida]|uniref:Uncharacterized protein n=1 Tax=Psilocybe cf. subviscida TaxID=2480587 RepID=A0A8H5BCF2_9AGAR|nr:hypothetical protein D9619_002156 [Psilocybe cf. subviscida]